MNLLWLLLFSIPLIDADPLVFPKKYHEKIREVLRDIRKDIKQHHYKMVPLPEFFNVCIFLDPRDGLISGVVDHRFYRESDRYPLVSNCMLILDRLLGILGLKKENEYNRFMSGGR